MFFSPKQNNGALKKNRNSVGSNKGHPCGVSGSAQQLCIVILGLPYRERLKRCCVRPQLLWFFSSNRFLKFSADWEKSRAGFRFLRMLLPSVNSRVSVALNRLICAHFRKGLSRALFRRGFSVHSFAGNFPVASFAGALTVHSFVGAFSLRSFAGAFSVRFFAGAFSVRSFAGPIPARSFAEAFPCAVSHELFQCALSSGLSSCAYSQRLFQCADSQGLFPCAHLNLEFSLIASFEWFDMLDACFLNFSQLLRDAF